MPREAESLYEETEASVSERQAMAEQRRAEAAATPRLEGRPYKKARRAIARFTGRDR